MLVAFLPALGALGISYLSSRQQQMGQASSAKATAKGVKARAKAAKTAAAMIPGKPRGTRSEGASGSPIVPSAAGGAFPGFGGQTTGGYQLPGFDFAGGGLVPSGPTGGGDCPGAFSVRIAGQCVDLTALPPGGDPAVTGQVGPGVSLAAPSGMGQLVTGYYGIGVVPRVEARTHRECPRGFKLGRDGVCYEHLARSQRMWDPGIKPLLTGGDRAAIARAARAARALERSKKSLKTASKALAKVC
jgi:hypothetical protein